MSKRSRARRDDILLTMLTSRDPTTSAIGRLVATGVPDLLRDFVDAEEDAGRSGEEAAITVVAAVGMLVGLMAGRRTRPVLDAESGRRVAGKMAVIFEDGVAKGIEMGTPRRD